MSKFQILSINSLQIVHVFRPQWGLLRDRALTGAYFFLDLAYFGGSRLCEFEKVMRNSRLCYYFSEEGYFDQFEIFYGQRRAVGSALLPLELEKVAFGKQFFTSFPFHQRGLRGQGLKGEFLSSSEERAEAVSEMEEAIYSAYKDARKGS